LSSFRSALVTGGRSGIGAAVVSALERDGIPVHVLDIVDGFDVADPRAWDDVAPIDLACLNAGIVTGEGDVTLLTDEQYRRALGVNVDGVVYGVRAAIDAMRDRGGAIVATASLAGIIPFPPDPVYDATKHAVVGLIRSVAPTLAPLGITANCVNPGMTDTNIMGDDARKTFAELDFPLMEPSQIADAVVLAVTSGDTGQCYVCQPGREHTPYHFHDVPGPRTESARGRVPPGMRAGEKLLDDFTA
jgi:NAD(P)-dependent dehydrogenase (short-subunit alcohol dehydrogenase family)